MCNNSQILQPQHIHCIPNVGVRGRCFIFMIQARLHMAYIWFTSATVTRTAVGWRFSTTHKRQTTTNLHGWAPSTLNMLRANMVKNAPEHMWSFTKDMINSESSSNVLGTNKANLVRLCWFLLMVGAYRGSECTTGEFGWNRCLN